MQRPFYSLFHLIPSSDNCTNGMWTQGTLQCLMQYDVWSQQNIQVITSALFPLDLSGGTHTEKTGKYLKTIKVFHTFWKPEISTSIKYPKGRLSRHSGLLQGFSGLNVSAFKQLLISPESNKWVINICKLCKCIPLLIPHIPLTELCIYYAG